MESQAIIAIMDSLELLLYLFATAVIASYTRDNIVKSFSKINRNLANLIDTKITFIGVIHHELSHAIIGVLTGAKVRNVRLFKISSKDGKLGEIILIPRGPWILRQIQLGLTAIAPLICGGATSIYISKQVINTGMTFDIRNVLIILIIAQIIYHMTLSKSDIKAALYGIVPLLVIIWSVGYVVPGSLRILIGYMLKILVIQLPFLGVSVLMKIGFKKRV